MAVQEYIGERGEDTWLSIIMYELANDEMMMKIQENVWECESGCVLEPGKTVVLRYNT